MLIHHPHCRTNLKFDHEIGRTVLTDYELVIENSVCRMFATFVSNTRESVYDTNSLQIRCWRRNWCWYSVYEGIHSKVLTPRSNIQKWFAWIKNRRPRKRKFRRDSIVLRSSLAPKLIHLPWQANHRAELWLMNH